MSGTLLAFMTAMKSIHPRRDDDYTDRLHYVVTANVLIALSVLISFRQFAGRPLECMVPDYFPGGWEQYAENYCWAQDTYFLSFDVDVTRKLPREHRISYYQWVPFFLLIEACCFRLPSLIWKYLAGHSGIRIHDIVRVAVDERNIQSDVKENSLKSLTSHLQNALRFHRRLHRKNVQPHRYVRVLNLPYSAIYVTFMYLFTKVLYLVNVWAQLLFMNKFLHTDKYAWYGWGALKDILDGNEWKTSGMFPRVTLCDFEVRGMGNLQNHTVQCVLVINIFNEKIFIFLWFWFLVLMIMTTISLIYWVFIMLLPWPSRVFISRHLELSEMAFDSKGSAKDVERFVSGYLKTDGVFVLRMITMHAGIIFGTDLVLSLWRSFYGIEEKIRKDACYLTPSPTDKRSAFDQVRQRMLKDDQQSMRSGKNIEENEHKQKDADLNEAPNKVTKRSPAITLIPTATGIALTMPDSKATTLEAKDKRSGRKHVKELRLIMPADSSEESNDEDTSGQQEDVEKGIPLLAKKSRSDSAVQRSSM